MQPSFSSLRLARIPNVIPAAQLTPADWAVIKKNLLRAPPAKMTFVDNAKLEDKAVYLGMDVKDPVVVGKPIRLVHYWKCLKPMPDWRLFSHLNSPGPKGRFINVDHVAVGGRYYVHLWKPGDIIRDEQLGTLYLKGYGRNPIGLAQIVFSIDELKASELGQFDIQKPKMYESIGPFEDMSGKITALVRIIRAEKAAEPQSIDQSYSRETIKLDGTAEQTDKNVYSVKEKVAEDLKKLAVMDAVKSKAEDFVKQVVKDGWDEAIRKFNLLYGNNVGQEQSEPNTFKLQSFTNLRRISGETLVTLAVQNSGNPAAYLLDNERKKQSRFINKLYSLVPSDKNALDTVPLIMEFKPEMSFYCLKHVSIKRLDQSQYEKIKAGYAYKEAFIQSQSLAAVHFNPENILKRMNFSRIVKTEERPDTNTPTEEGETL